MSYYLTKIENLVFQGGGVRGTAYLGALEELLNQQHHNRIDLKKIKRVCGASAGAICALLLSLGYSITELNAILLNLNMKDFLREQPADDISVGGFNKENTFTLLYEMCTEIVLETQADPARNLSAFDFGVYMAYQVIKKLGLDIIQAKLELSNTEIVEGIKGDENTSWLENFWNNITLSQRRKEFSNWLASMMSEFLAETFDQFLMKIVEYITTAKIISVDTKLKDHFRTRDRPDTYDNFMTAIYKLAEYFYQRGYLFTGEALLAWFKGRIREKFRIVDPATLTFEALHQFAKKSNIPDLYLVGVNLTSGYTQVFSYLHTPSVRVAEAVRVSMSIPLFFQAYQMNNSMDLWTDGGVNDNYPIWVFDNEGIPNPKTLGLRLVNKETKQLLEIGNLPPQEPPQPPLRYDASLRRYIPALIAAIRNKQENDFFHSPNLTRTILIDIQNVGMIEFDLSEPRKEQKRNALIESAKQCTDNFKQYRQHYDTVRYHSNPALRAYKTGIFTGIGSMIAFSPFISNSMGWSISCGLVSGGISAMSDIFTSHDPKFQYRLIKNNDGYQLNEISLRESATAATYPALAGSTAIAAITYLTVSNNTWDLLGLKNYRQAALAFFMCTTTIQTGAWHYLGKRSDIQQIKNGLADLPDGWKQKALSPRSNYSPWPLFEKFNPFTAGGWFADAAAHMLANVDVVGNEQPAEQPPPVAPRQAVRRGPPPIVPRQEARRGPPPIAPRQEARRGPPPIAPRQEARRGLPPPPPPGALQQAPRRMPQPVVARQAPRRADTQPELNVQQRPQPIKFECCCQRVKAGIVGFITSIELTLYQNNRVIKSDKLVLRDVNNQYEKFFDDLFQSPHWRAEYNSDWWHARGGGAQYQRKYSIKADLFCENFQSLTRKLTEAKTIIPGASELHTKFDLFMNI